jgi:hypothetical protein
MGQIKSDVAVNKVTSGCATGDFPVRHLTRIGFEAETLQWRWAGVAQLVQRLSTGWTVQGSNFGWGKGFRIRADRPWGPPSLL